MTAKQKPTTGTDQVDDYLARVPKEFRAPLERLRQTVRALVPEATEVISYQVPTFKYRGRMLVSYAAFKDHCSFFPGAGPIERHQKELARYQTSKGTVRFSPDQPLSDATIRKLVRSRIQLDEEKWKTRS